MKVHEIPVIRVLIKSYQNKAEKPTMKQSIKVLNIKVMTAIIKQDGKTIKQAGLSCAKFRISWSCLRFGLTSKAY